MTQSSAPKFRAGDLVRLRPSAILPEYAQGLLRETWLLRGNVRYDLYGDKRWRIPEGDVHLLPGREFCPTERLLELVSHPPEKGAWADCAWKPKEFNQKEEE